MTENIKSYIVTPDTQFAILGLGKFGRSVAKELIINDCHVFCCDINRHVVHEMAQCTEHVIEADVTDEETLDGIGIANFDIVIISLSKDFASSIITTMMAKEKGCPFIIAKANDIRHKRILEKIGADYVVLPELEMGKKVANSLMTNDPLEQIHSSDKFDIIEILPKEKWIGKTLIELELRKREKINVLGIIRDDNLLESIEAKTKILASDILIVLKAM